MPDFRKNVSAFLDYKLDWTDELYSAGAPLDSAVSAGWIVPSGITAVATALAGPTATIWLSGGVPGDVYTVTNLLWTSSGREHVTAFTIGTN